MNFFILNMMSVLIIGYLSNDLYLPTLTMIAQEFHASPNHIQLSITAWFIGCTVFQLFLGPISDIYGRKPILIGSMLVLISGSVWCAFSTHIVFLLIGRMIQGISVSGIMVVTYASVHETYAASEQKATKMLGYLVMAAALSPLLGPAVGGYTANHLGWRVNFYMVTGLSFIFSLILWHFLHEGHALKKQKHFDWQKIIQNYKILIQDFHFTLTVLSYSFLYFCAAVFYTSVTFMVVDILHITPSHTGLIFVPVMICYLAGAGLAGHVVKRIGDNRTIWIALITATTVLAGFTVASFMMVPTVLILTVVVSIYYLCYGFAGPPLNNISLSCAVHSKGAGAALLTFGMMLGSTLGSLTMSILYNGTMSMVAIVMCSAVIAATACYGFFTIKKTS